MGLELEAVSFPLDDGNLLELALALVSNLGSSASLVLATSSLVKSLSSNSKSSYTFTWS